jgi:hypothetical protein
VRCKVFKPRFTGYIEDFLILMLGKLAGNPLYRSLAGVID